MSKYAIILYGYERGKHPKKVYYTDADNPITALHNVLAPNYGSDIAEANDKVDVLEIKSVNEFTLQEVWAHTGFKT